MRHRKPILALLLALTWLFSVFHVGLEANGWLPEHAHQAVHVVEHAHEHADDDHGHEHAPTPEHASDQAHVHTHAKSGHPDSAHEPVIARSSASEGRSILWLLAFCAPFLGAVFWFALTLRPRVFSAPPPPRWREEHALTRWCFIWRCASFTTAPPVLA